MLANSADRSPISYSGAYMNENGAIQDAAAPHWEPHPVVDSPKPMLPRVPILSPATFNDLRAASVASVMDAGPALPVTAARTAMALSLRRLGIGPGHKVLVPAYHCPSMVEPILWTGASPVFYRIRWDTSADMDDLRAKFDRSTRAILAVHYFGFPKNMTEVRAFCEDKGSALIEDCAHCFFGQAGNRPVGSIGTYAIASAVKFFPVDDGGYLVSSSEDLGGIDLEPPGAKASIKAIANLFEGATDFGRFASMRPLLVAASAARNGIRRSLSRKIGARDWQGAAPAGEVLDDAKDRFDPEKVHVGMSLASRMVVRRASKGRIIEARRVNYLRLLQGLSGVPGCTPLFADLPDGVVPYMFPLLFDDVRSAYPALAREAIPITHYGKYMCDGVSPATCPVTTQYSRRLLQFSCHQELLADEIEWMIERMRHVMRSLSRTGAGT